MPMNNPATADSSLSVLGLIADASLLVQAVMLILFLASIISWFMIDRKRSSFKRYANIANDFEEEFWSGGEMTRIYQKWSAEGISEGIANIFIAGYREYNRLAQKSNVGRSDMVDGVHRSMRVALSREIDHLETNLSFLATVGSISPYVGLFGTVVRQHLDAGGVAVIATHIDLGIDAGILELGGYRASTPLGGVFDEAFE